MNDKTVKITNLDNNEVRYGYFTNYPVIGERFILTPISFEDNKFGITTGLVLNMKNQQFETYMGTYKYEFV